MTRHTFAPFMVACLLACNGGGGSGSTGSNSGPDATSSTGGDSTVSGSSTGGDGSGSESATMGSGVPTTGVEPTTSGTTSSGTTAEVSTTSETTSSGTTAEVSTSGTTTETSSTTEAMPVDPCEPDPCLESQQCVEGACVDPGRPGEGQVIVVEMMIDPLLSDFDAEWFELKNVSDEHLDLDGCRLADLGANNDDYLIDADGSLVIAPGERMVMAKTADQAVNGGLGGVAHAFGQGFSLTNTGDAFILRCDDVDVDIVEFAPQAWPFGVGVGIQLDPGQEDATANDDPAAWCAAADEYFPMHKGTPGAVNPPCG